MDRAINGYLQTGLLLQFLAVSGMIVSHYIFEGQGFFVWDLRHTTPAMRGDSWYRLTLLLMNILYLMGAVHLVGFQATLSDDSAWARGYRAGSKFLGTAVLFDTVAAVMQVAGAYSFYANYSEIYWTHFHEGNLDWIFGAGARTIHAIGWLLFAHAFLLLEIYHDEGTNDWHGIINWFIWGLGGIVELSVLILSDPSIGIAIGWIGLLSALVWAMAFEQEVNGTTPKLNESELCNDLERDVDEFSRRAMMAQ